MSRGSQAVEMKYNYRTLLRGVINSIVGRKKLRRLVLEFSGFFYFTCDLSQKAEKFLMEEIIWNG